MIAYCNITLKKWHKVCHLCKSVTFCHTPRRFPLIRFCEQRKPSGMPQKKTGGGE